MPKIQDNTPTLKNTKKKQLSSLLAKFNKTRLSESITFTAIEIEYVSF